MCHSGHLGTDVPGRADDCSHIVCIQLSIEDALQASAGADCKLSCGMQEIRLGLGMLKKGGQERLVAQHPWLANCRHVLFPLWLAWTR